MSAELAARVIHWSYAALFVVLAASGLLLLYPELRSLLVGGYALYLSRIHWWSGVAAVGVPLAVGLAAGPQALVAHAHRDRGPGGAPWRRWRESHAGFVAVSAGALAGSGVLMRWRRALPQKMVDWAYRGHDFVACAAIAMLVAHLLAVALSRARRREGLRAP